MKGSSDNGKRILVVDDEEPIRSFLRDAFEQHGYAVIEAASSEEALAILARESVPLMFLDLKLPGMSGVDLCRRIRSDHPIACIYAMTGYTSLFELADCREVGFDDYFIKPVDLKQFLQAAQQGFEKIERWTERHANRERETAS